MTETMTTTAPQDAQIGTATVEIPASVKFTLKMIAGSLGLSSMEQLAEKTGIKVDRLRNISSGRGSAMSAKELLILAEASGLHPKLIETDYDQESD